MKPLTPKEAVEIIEEGAPYKVPANPPPTEGRAAKEAKLLGSTKEAIALRKAEINGEIKLLQSKLNGEINTIKASETAKERAGKHLAVFGALYLCTCTIAFLFSMSVLDTDSIAVAATLVTLVVTQLASILKTVVDTKEPKDPVELMSEIVHVTLGNETDTKPK
jgi:hypothetical protein